MFKGINSLTGGALLAPMAGISNLPFRLMARSFGCALAFTEMISANGLIRKSGRTLGYLETCAAEDDALGVQIFGANPEIMADAAGIAVDRGADLIDINMGCPVKKVIRTGAGAILLKDPVLAGRIISAVKKAACVPVTVKIRSGWSPQSINAVEIAGIAEESGADAIIVHGRTAVQGFAGNADWKIIAAVKEKINVPVIGNGDIWHAHDALRMRQETSCDAVMVGRGALGNPWIFEGICRLSSGEIQNYLPDLGERQRVIMRHWEMEKEYMGEKAANRNFRKHLLWYTKGLEGAAGFRQLTGKLPDAESMLSELVEYFRSLEELRSNGPRREIMP